MWYVFGVVCVIVVIIVVVAVFVILRFYRRQYIGNPVPATHKFNFQSGNTSPETRNKVSESYERIPYISLAAIEELVAPKPDLHYSCRDVTTLPAVAANGGPQIDSCSCSGILETHIDKGCKNENNEEHIYEDVY
jgi:hypothetical protein